ncbi:HD domain-containing protein [Pseudoduganella flava]|uniref:HD domain-containing protein n=1 Tax=Pseudoduganella flava TaxID=871742 RepID=A0A562PH38_9BURK|nr:HD domain-containing phosphohydrolase [Pseudoduganella flava]QGZ42507.1 phosphohydrolase [Pseudoduganella flava]TWI43653.1 HD domain-containing protein [Pseudoduganella flava]
MTFDDTVSVADAVQALALVGDLSMGQPTDHSIRTARLAARVADMDGAGPAGCATARTVALLRWSGCTANASGFAALMGDDVGGRHAMLTRTLPPNHPLTFTSVAPLAQVHCEVSGDIARMLGLPLAVEEALRHVFEHVDGSGMPYRLRGAAIPNAVFHVALAGDLEILSRAHGLDAALRLIGELAGRKYPAALVRLVTPHARAWLDALDDDTPCGDAPPSETRVALTLVADMLELKLPALAGFSRRVADVARGAAALLGLPPAQQQCVGRAALIHGLGRAAVPNGVWQREGKLRTADWEKVRLVPYWTARAAIQIPALTAEAQLASHVYERLDGSGYFRSLTGDALSPSHRVLAAAAAWTALCSPRPWRPAYEPAAATALLAAQAARFDRAAVDAVIASAGGTQAPAPRRSGLLSDREVDVLRRISTGESNKEAARALRISPSTVRTHIESIFRKLECSTRAAATLKALTLGLI